MCIFYSYVCFGPNLIFVDGYQLGHGLRYPHGLLKQLERYLPTISRVVRLPTLLMELPVEHKGSTTFRFKMTS